VGARDAERGCRAAGRLGARFVQLDVTDDASVAAAAKEIEADGGLDILVNNAGIEGRTPDNGVIGAADETAAHMRALFDTNVFGMVRVLHAFLPLLARSAAPAVVNLSSGLSKTTDLANPDGPVHFYPGVAYPASKAAVNMVTVQYAKAYPAIKINAVDPGYTATDLNGGTGTQTAEQGAEIIVRMARIGRDGPTGGYFDASGSVAW
jgi:NAD(P)-dependent dehydrogenase (short-subunit alcohol dehydrogenase family)